MRGRGGVEGEERRGEERKGEDEGERVQGTWTRRRKRKKMNGWKRRR